MVAANGATRTKFQLHYAVGQPTRTDSETVAAGFALKFQVTRAYRSNHLIGLEYNFPQSDHYLQYRYHLHNLGYSHPYRQDTADRT